MTRLLIFCFFVIHFLKKYCFLICHVSSVMSDTLLLEDKISGYWLVSWLVLVEIWEILTVNRVSTLLVKFCSAL